MSSSIPELLPAEDLAEFRAIAESTLKSRARVRRENGTTVVDGMRRKAWQDVLDDTPFKLSESGGGRGASRTKTIGSTQVEFAARTGKFPADTVGLRDGDVIQITEGENADVFLSIVEATGKDQQVALRVPVIEIQTPEGWT